MTVNDMIAVLNEIKEKDRDRSVAIGGCLIIDHDKPIEEFDFTWMDCSDGILILVN